MSAEIGGDVKKMFDSIEDIVAQADEVDEKYLQVRAAGKIWNIKTQNLNRILIYQEQEILWLINNNKKSENDERIDSARKHWITRCGLIISYTTLH